MGQGNYERLAPAGYQSITATSSTAGAVTVTAFAASAASATRPEPSYAVIVPETAGIRWRDDGTAAVNATSGGAPLAAGQYMEYDGPIRSLSFISQSGSAVVHVSLYRTS